MHSLCSKCGLHAKAKNPFMDGFGYDGEDGILVIVSGPTAKDDLVGKIFSSDQNRFFKSTLKILKKSSISKSIDKIRVEPLIRCGRYNYRTDKFLDCCFHFIEGKIEKFKPSKIILLGSYVIKSFVKEELKVLDVLGGYFDYEASYGYVKSYFMFDIRYALEDKSLIYLWRKSFYRIILEDICDKWLPLDEVDVKFVTGSKEGKRVLKELSAYDIVAFDTEYNKDTNRLLCASFAVKPNEAYSFTGEVLDLLVYELDDFFDRDIIFIAHNRKFDNHVLINSLDMDSDIFLDGRWVDTLDIRKFVHNETKAALDVVDWQVGLGGHKDALFALLGGSHTGKAYEKAYNKSRDVVLDYCGLDSLACYRIYFKYLDIISKDNIDKYYKEILNPLGDVFFDLEITGISLDEESLDSLGFYLQNKIQEQKLIISNDSIIQKMVRYGEFNSVAKNNSKAKFDDEGNVLFNPNSSDHIRLYLFDSKYGLKEKSIKKTKGGKSGKRKKATDADVRKKLSSYPVVKAISEYSRLSKLYNTYVKGWSSKKTKKNTLHSTYKPIGARTGRPTSSEPNLLNVPGSRNEEAIRLRKLITVPEVPLHIKKRFGSVELFFGEADESQVELRQLAMESKDEKMISCFINREDIHRLTASEVAGVSLDSVTSDQRQQAKAVNFGIVFGMGALGLKKYAESSYGVILTEKEAADLLAGLLRTYRGIKPFHRVLLKKARKIGGVWVNWCGKPYRFRPVFGLLGKDVYKRGSAERIVINTPIQGGASLYTSRALIKLHKMKRTGELFDYGIVDIVGTVYDSIWFIGIRGEEKRVLDLMGYVMACQDTIHGVPLEIEMKVGSCLGDMKEYGVRNSMDGLRLPSKISKSIF